MSKCDGCPIKGTEHCHRVNPMAKKYTRSEKEMLREEMDKRTHHTLPDGWYREHNEWDAAKW